MLKITFSKCDFPYINLSLMMEAYLLSSKGNILIVDDNYLFNNNIEFEETEEYLCFKIPGNYKIIDEDIAITLSTLNNEGRKLYYEVMDGKEIKELLIESY